MCPSRAHWSKSRPAGAVRVGDACLLRLELASDAAITMETTVAHVEGRHVGLHCERLDLDSMTHLRQLVEHNADDPALLERDLATLVDPGPRRSLTRRSRSPDPRGPIQ